MSSFSEEVTCHKCDSEHSLHVNTDSGDPEGNYAYCLECGYSRRMMEEQMTLEELNEEREIWELSPLTELKAQT